MSTIHRYIINQKARALSEGIIIVRNILKSNPFPKGFTTSQLFQVAVQQPAPPDFPSYHHTVPAQSSKRARPIVPGAPTHPDHPIRSLRFLKAEVLPALVNSREIKKILRKASFPEEGSDEKMTRDSFVWTVVDPNEKKKTPPPRFKKEVIGREVGVDLDYGHLNKRRQNARVKKITRDVKAMKDAWRQEQTTPKGS